MGKKLTSLVLLLTIVSSVPLFAANATSWKPFDGFAANRNFASENTFSFGNSFEIFSQLADRFKNIFSGFGAGNLEKIKADNEKIKSTWQKKSNTTTTKVKNEATTENTYNTTTQNTDTEKTWTKNNEKKQGQENSQENWRKNKQNPSSTTPVTNPGTTTPGTNPTSTPGTNPATTPSTNPGNTQWGAFIAGGNLTSFESQVGKQVNMQAVFIGWGGNGSFPTQLANTLKSQGKTLVIYWEPNVDYDSINSGSWDSYMTSFAQAAKNSGANVILLPFHEMNGDWDTWGITVGDNSPQKFIDAWRKMKNIFSSATNVKFGLAMNNVSVPNTTQNQIAAFYPGDAYVDYVGVDGFNFGNPWKSFDQTFAQSLNTLKSYNKPLYIFSMACADGAQKAAWITDAFETQIPKYNLAGWIWFNENKERNWLVSSDSASLQAFKNALQ